MEINLSEEQLQEAINTQINKAVENALSGYDVQRAIADKLTNDVASGLIGSAINAAVSTMDTQKLTNTLSAEIQKAMTASVVNILHEGLCNTLMSLRNIPSYDDKKREATRLEILAMLKR